MAVLWSCFFLSLWGKWSLKLSYPVLKPSNILLTHWLLITIVLFVIGRIYSNHFKCNYQGNKKLFSEPFPAFLKSTSNFEHFEKKWRSYIMYFRRLRKILLDKCLKSPISEYRLTPDMLKSLKYCLNLHHASFIISLSLWKKWSWKMSLSVISEILALFFSTLNTDDKYSLRSSETLRQLIQMKLSKKQNTFSQLFTLILKSASNVEHS